jgi:hypothetical protein
VTKDELLQKLEKNDVQDELDELVHDLKSMEAANINNAGYAEQVDYLLESGNTPQTIAVDLGLA